MDEESFCIDTNDSVCKNIQFEEEASNGADIIDSFKACIDAVKANPRRLRTFAALKLRAEQRTRDLEFGSTTNFSTTITNKDLHDCSEAFKSSTLQELKAEILQRRQKTEELMGPQRKSKRKATETNVEVTAAECSQTRDQSPGGWKDDEDENIAFGNADDLRDCSSMNAVVEGGIPPDLVTRTLTDNDISPTCVSDLSELSGLSKAQLIDMVVNKDKVISEKDGEIAELKCGRKKAKVAKGLPKPQSALDSRLLKEMTRVLKEEVMQWLHNQPKHWEIYSDNEGAICHIIMSEMQGWPATADAKYKENIWKRLLGPNLNRRWSVVKNEVVQRMRTLFLSKLECLMLR